MIRLVLTLAIGTLLAAWADAQQNGPVLVADRVKMLQSNRPLVEKLIGHGMALADTTDPLKRAVACRGALGDLVAALNTAIAARDANRIAELGEHLSAIADDGFA